MNKKWLVLYSGGLDSIVLAHLLKYLGDDVTLLHMHYGQRAQNIEHECSKEYAKHINSPIMNFDVTPTFTSILSQLNLNISQVSRLWDANASAGGEKDAESSLSYVPFRNTLFLTIAGMCAEQLGIEWITYGSNLSETMTYSDNSEPFIRAMNQVMKLGSNARNIEVRAPLFSLTKTKLVQLGVLLHTPFHLSNSCYFPVDNKPCGECGSCLLRINAFKRNNIIDPLFHGTNVVWTNCDPYSTYTDKPIDNKKITTFLNQHLIPMEL